MSISIIEGLLLVAKLLIVSRYPETTVFALRGPECRYWWVSTTLAQRLQLCDPPSSLAVFRICPVEVIQTEQVTVDFLYLFDSYYSLSLKIDEIKSINKVTLSVGADVNLFSSSCSLHIYRWLKVKPGLTSQRHSALISSDSEYFQVCFSAVHYLKISGQRWFSSEQRWKRKFSELKISAETALFSSETELIQSWTALIFSETALKLEIFRAKNQRWIRAVSALIFSETELIFSETALKHQKSRARKISSESVLFQRWFSLKESWYPLKPS